MCNAKVTPKKIEDYLKSNNIIDKTSVVSGLDITVKSSLKPFIQFKNLVNNGLLTYSDVEKSVHISEIYDRLWHYPEMLKVLDADSLFFKSLHGYFKGIASDCVLTRSVENEGVFSFLFLRQRENVFFPCSFFTRHEQREYTKDGTHWNVISITEITK